EPADSLALAVDAQVDGVEEGDPRQGKEPGVDLDAGLLVGVRLLSVVAVVADDLAVVVVDQLGAELAAADDAAVRPGRGLASGLRFGLGLRFRLDLGLRLGRRVGVGDDRVRRRYEVLGPAARTEGVLAHLVVLGLETLPAAATQWYRHGPAS